MAELILCRMSRSRRKNVIEFIRISLSTKQTLMGAGKRSGNEKFENWIRHWPVNNNNNKLMSQTRKLVQKSLLFEWKVSMTVTYKKYIGRQWRIKDFPDRRGCQPHSLRRKPIIWNAFCRKLHRNEENWANRGVRVKNLPHVDPPLRKCVGQEFLKQLSG